ncbi:MAG: type II toxin-antitoxin system RelE/ParE family toxin [Hyphomicrobiales bacterium]|nr:type II toxin-antitoxin system RelE/ParE family toxin [Hyphomicrobiales bacterium]
MTRAVLTRLAAGDLRRASDWYDDINPKLGERFEAVIESKLRQIAGHPRRFPFHHGVVRRASLLKFPYRVFFIETGAKQVVIAILRDSQDDAVLRSRTN